MVEMAKNFALVIGVTSLPIIAWYSLLAFAKRTSRGDEPERMHPAE